MVTKKKPTIEAVAYMRTSSASNVGTDKDSDKRQRSAITAFAKANGYVIVAEFYDAAVKGSDPVPTRPGRGEASWQSPTDLTASPELGKILNLHFRDAAE